MGQRTGPGSDGLRSAGPDGTFKSGNGHNGLSRLYFPAVRLISSPLCLFYPPSGGGVVCASGVVVHPLPERRGLNLEESLGRIDYSDPNGRGLNFPGRSDSGN